MARAAPVIVACTTTDDSSRARRALFWASMMLDGRPRAACLIFSQATKLMKTLIAPTTAARRRPSGDALLWPATIRASASCPTHSAPAPARRQWRCSTVARSCRCRSRSRSTGRDATGGSPPATTRSMVHIMLPRRLSARQVSEPAATPTTSSNAPIAPSRIAARRRARSRCPCAGVTASPATPGRSRCPIPPGVNAAPSRASRTGASPAPGKWT